MPAYSLPDLPYDYAALEPHYSARIVELHHDTHHAGYVKQSNAALEELVDAAGVGLARPVPPAQPREGARVQRLRPPLAHRVLAHDEPRRRG